MLSPAPVAEDEGNACTLPNGKQVNLRSTFPASGLYRIGSTRPLWDVNWYGEKGWLYLSPKGRWLVRVNRFGDGGYPRNESLDWGIRFYDSGKQINNHNVRDLVDYPSLMSQTSMDWHLIWVHESDDPELRDGFFWLKTSTRATFRFDIATGEIVEEHRFWRHVARISIATLITVCLVICFLVYRRCKRVSCQPVVRPAPQKATEESAEAPKRFTFRLRTLFVIVTVAAVFSRILSMDIMRAAVRWIPGIVIFTAAIVIAVLLTKRLSKSRQCGWRRAGLRSSVFLAWVMVYILSIGPFIAVTRYYQCQDDIRWAFFQTVYAPVYYSQYNLHFRKLLNLYGETWR